MSETNSDTLVSSKFLRIINKASHLSPALTSKERSTSLIGRKGKILLSLIRIYLWHLCLSVKTLRLNFFRKREWLSDRQAGIQFNLQPMDWSCCGPSMVWSCSRKETFKENCSVKRNSKEKKHRQIRYKISREAYVCFFYLKSDKFTCAAEREDLPRPQYFVHIYVTKHWNELFVLCRISIIN